MEHDSERSEAHDIDPYSRYICEQCGLYITNLQDIVYHADTGEYTHSDDAHREYRALGFTLTDALGVEL